MQPQFTDHRQTIDVRLFEGNQKRLDQPIDLEVFMERIDKNGNRISTRNETANNIPPKPLLPRWLNNILVIVCTVLSTLLILMVLLLLTKHFKMKSLIASLELTGLPTMEPTLKYHLN